MKKIKVLHIAQSAGGVARYLKDFLTNSNQERYQHLVIASKDYEGNQAIRKKSDKIFLVDMIRKIDLRKDINAIKEIRKIVKKEKPDILYLHSSKAGALGRIAFIRQSKN